MFLVLSVEVQMKTAPISKDFVKFSRTARYS